MCTSLGIQHRRSYKLRSYRSVRFGVLDIFSWGRCNLGVPSIRTAWGSGTSGTGSTKSSVKSPRPSVSHNGTSNSHKLWQLGESDVIQGSVSHAADLWHKYIFGSQKLGAHNFPASAVWTVTTSHCACVQNAGDGYIFDFKQIFNITISRPEYTCLPATTPESAIQENEFGEILFRLIMRCTWRQILHSRITAQHWLQLLHICTWNQ